ncbi:Uncharacterised protein [Vibrio cholerae]|nr:Uncharacterised protein [Vibrio cholerae]CSB27805.1 Uncharacterised protein [Vibrio cholerae]CSC23149.1 Uncharacterised protein [Vibrio cholerae]CSI37445.1 Uncharacterised protein [Vibrio cholerae]CSI42975.1 Uncharacterised protein [Vibrio cholerae]
MGHHVADIGNQQPYRGAFTHLGEDIAFTRQYGCGGSITNMSHDVGFSRGHHPHEIITQFGHDIGFTQCEYTG